MTPDEVKQLREDFYLWLHFCIHDAQYQEAMRSKYSQADIDAAIREIEHWLRTWVNSSV